MSEVFDDFDRPSFKILKSSSETKQSLSEEVTKMKEKKKRVESSQKSSKNNLFFSDIFTPNVNSMYNTSIV